MFRLTFVATKHQTTLHIYVRLCARMYQPIYIVWMRDVLRTYRTMCIYSYIWIGFFVLSSSPSSSSSSSASSSSSFTSDSKAYVSLVLLLQDHSGISLFDYFAPVSQILFLYSIYYFYSPPILWSSFGSYTYRVPNTLHSIPLRCTHRCTLCAAIYRMNRRSV
jgi:hypothetical protein